MRRSVVATVVQPATSSTAELTHIAAGKMRPSGPWVTNRKGFAGELPPKWTVADYA
jgi:hypothetical protein